MAFIPFISPTDTIPEQRLFKVLLGPLGPDVALVNITFPSEVLSVADCGIRGYMVLEHMSPDSSSKYFSLQVPFQDRVVQQKVRICLTNWGNWFDFSLDQGVNIYFFFSLTERVGEDNLLSPPDLWLVGPARVCPVFSLCPPGHRYE